MILYLLILVATALSLMAIPLMRRVAPRIGLLDMPGEARKVHKAPVPRVGGWGIVLGIVLPASILMPASPLLHSYLAGVAILFISGVLDDIHELGHYPKFAAQIAAALVVVLHGHLWVWHMPLMGLDPWSPTLGVPFTVFAIVGMINAINHSDGLDGLAGGEALLSLVVILFLGTAHGADAFLVMLAAATIGGILGFLRYNTHPATVFMGDAGSQVVGFTLAVLVIDLTQRVAPVLSPAVVLFLLGLPVMDIVAVLIQRVWHGMNWFKASRNHLHHRLLDLGLDHYDVVVIIYGLQAAMVIAGVLLRFESDALVLAVYAALCAAIFGTITWLERRGWRLSGEGQGMMPGRLIAGLRQNRLLCILPARLLLVLVCGYLLLAALASREVPADFGWMAVALLLVLAVDRMVLKGKERQYALMVVYITGVFTVFLARDPHPLGWLGNPVESVLFLVMALLVALAVKFDRKIHFGTTPLDYLMVLGLVTITLLAAYYRQLLPVSMLVVKMVVLLYAMEVAGQRAGADRSALYLSASGALLLLAGRGLL
ncbi:MAG: undecaprenyl/decaprenyl-phosphate alpha-N-acetylglucosaminyl 1-phosphate transferase [Gammaproteobacteria bacterium]|nr:MAG: undecaprenyl/decaprenyl-phosphate alpha-N-acetylglucosaminyl 1-phosphate transferase [Gammaproteobacteria bacterium]